MSNQIKKYPDFNTADAPKYCQYGTMLQIYIETYRDKLRWKIIELKDFNGQCEYKGTLSEIKYFLDEEGFLFRIILNTLPTIIQKQII